MWRRVKFRHAGIGRGADLQVRTEIRTDRVLWLDAEGCTGAQRLYLDTLERLRQTGRAAHAEDLLRRRERLTTWPH